MLLGFAAATLVGVPLGLAMGWSRACEAFVNPTFLLLRPIPPLAWIPLAIVWLGLGDAAKVLVIWFAAFVPAVINSYAGVRSIEPYLIEAARTLGVSRGMLVREVLIPGAMPMIFTGLRLSLQACWTTLVAAELIGAIAGPRTRAVPGVARPLPGDDRGRHGGGGAHGRGDDAAARRPRAACNALAQGLRWTPRRAHFHGDAGSR